MKSTTSEHAISPSRARREREKAETRELILEAARTLFTAEGYAQTSMRRIADQIGYTATAIYHHFADKDALLNELCLNDFRALGEALRQMEQLPDPIDRIRAMGVNYIKFAVDHPEQFRFMFLVERPIPGPDVITIDPAEDGYAFLLTNVQEAMERGAFLPQFTDAELLSQIFWGSVHGLAVIHVTKPRDGIHPWLDLRAPGESAEAMVDVVCRGVLKPTPV